MKELLRSVPRVPVLEDQALFAALFRKDLSRGLRSHQQKQEARELKVRREEVRDLPRVEVMIGRKSVLSGKEGQKGAAELGEFNHLLCEELGSVLVAVEEFSSFFDLRNPQFKAKVGVEALFNPN